MSEQSIHLPKTLTIELAGEAIELDPLDPRFLEKAKRVTARINAWAILVRHYHEEAASAAAVKDAESGAAG